MRATTTALLATVLMAALTGPAISADTTVAELTIHDPWARASVGSGAGAAYFSVVNNGHGDDRLLAASTDVADAAELHTHIKDGDVMRMRRIDAIDLPAGATTALQPGGLHVMLLGLKAPLQSGEVFPLTLSFANAGDVTVEVQVKDVATPAPADAASPGKMEHKSH